MNENLYTTNEEMRGGRELEGGGHRGGVRREEGEGRWGGGRGKVGIEGGGRNAGGRGRGERERRSKGEEGGREGAYLSLTAAGRC